MKNSWTVDDVTGLVVLITPLTVHGPQVPSDPNCGYCDIDRHTCPGCGEWLYHGTTVCLECVEYVRQERKHDVI